MEVTITGCDSPLLRMIPLHLQRNIRLAALGSIFPQCGRYLIIFDESIRRKEDCPVHLVRQASVPPANHHEADDDLAEDVELSAEGC